MSYRHWLAALFAIAVLIVLLLFCARPVSTDDLVPAAAGTAGTVQIPAR